MTAGKPTRLHRDSKNEFYPSTLALVQDADHKVRPTVNWHWHLAEVETHEESAENTIN